ncbi:MAG: Smr/MutS family protein [Odoribacteraceae bacterium]|jgi:DNA mismatch repair protein MutS2|nr:Smr/MutS family protein [Odoribacteraceae bacterium]
MIYPANFEAKIKFDKIRQLIAGNCLCEMGRELADEMAFSTDEDTIRAAQEETNEAMCICRVDVDFPAASCRDARPFLGRIRVEGLFMEVEELVILRSSLESLNAILRFFKGKETTYPRLAARASSVHFFPYILQRLDSVLTKNGAIKDSASPALADIRHSIARKQAGISRRMQALLQQARDEGWADKDSEIAIRDGRMVIPLPSAFKRQIRGIVHDESATGKTSYIEPAEIIETNNEIRELQGEERREIARILRQLSADIRPYVPDLLPSYDFLAFIDFVRAKARFALNADAVAPAFVNAPFARWRRARHPLLLLALRAAGKEIVPLDMEINEKQRLILISGPNAGGKSVCLQTAGLLQYMFQCGIPVPVEDDSRFGIFQNILIDIGDEQSIENDLSTYSSHLINMKHFTRHADSRSLVLIDEFGAGTEPMLGGAIAEAILNALNNNAVKGIITTHYTNLKHFAASAEGIVNGAMLYDAGRMTPLFTLEIGNPGSSFAFEIAKKIGLPREIIEDATGKIGEERVNFDKHLKDVIRDKHYWEEKRKRIHQNEKQLEDVLQKYQRALEETVKLRKQILAEAKEKARDILRGANSSIESTIREIKESQADKERTKQARRALDEDKKRLLEDDEEEKRLLQRVEQLKNREKRKEEREKRPPRALTATARREDPENAALSRGDRVQVDNKTIGEVIEVNAKSVVVALGSLITTVKPSRLTRISAARAKDAARDTPPTPHHSNYLETVDRARADFKPEIDLRGLRGDEALQRVEALVDSAVMLDVRELRLIHGTGTGALKQLLREHLRANPFVARLEDEHVQRGGAGVTRLTLEP